MPANLMPSETFFSRDVFLARFHLVPRRRKDPSGVDLLERGIIVPEGPEYGICSQALLVSRLQKQAVVGVPSGRPIVCRSRMFVGHWESLDSAEAQRRSGQAPVLKI